MSIDEQIAVLQAYKEGKTIMVAPKEGDVAALINIEQRGQDFEFDFNHFENTIISEPREFWIVDVPVRSRLVFNRESEALETHKSYQELGCTSELIHVREVTGE